MNDDLAKELQQRDGEGKESYFARLVAAREIAQMEGDEEKTDEIIAYTNLMLYENIIGFVRKHILSKFSTYVQRYGLQELENEAMAAVYSEFYKYDGKHKLTTFAKVTITHAIVTYVGNQAGYTRYYNELVTKITHAKNQLMAEGYEESAITVYDVQNILGHNITVSQVRNAMNQMERKAQASFDPEYHSAMTEQAASPEEILINQEKMQEAKKLLSALKPFDRYILMKFAGIIDGNNYNFKTLGLDEDFIEHVRHSEYTDTITRGNISVNSGKDKKIMEGIEYVPTDKVQRMYKMAQLAVAELRETRGEAFGYQPQTHRAADSIDDAMKNMEIIEGIDISDLSEY